uniref:Uncharacterized protein n=1 Tax=Anguilla anguilla TaxID=7936 RepID=A0A0E9XC11_ANGAN
MKRLEWSFWTAISRRWLIMRDSPLCVAEDSASRCSSVWIRAFLVSCMSRNGSVKGNAHHLPSSTRMHSA